MKQRHQCRFIVFENTIRTRKRNVRQKYLTLKLKWKNKYFYTSGRS